MFLFLFWASVAVIEMIYPLKYENIVEKLKGIGADIKRIRVPEPDELTKVV